MKLTENRYLHISKPKLEISDDESLNSQINTPNISNANLGKDRFHSEQCDMNTQEFTTLDSKGRDGEEGNDDLGLSLLSAKFAAKLEG